MQAVIFDVDGTLVDSVDLHARAWQQTFEHFGHPVSFAHVRSQIGKGGDQLLPVFLTADEIAARGPEIERHRGELFKREFLRDVKPFPQVRGLFERLLNDGWKIALASSAKKDELEIYTDICEVTDLVDTATSSDDAEKSKPYPDIFKAAAARLKLAPDQCIVVGDTPYDAEAAEKAGMPSMGFLCGGFPPDDLKRAGCVVVYEDAADLLKNYRGSMFDRKRPS